MATIDESPSAKRWLPLEANPDVMNQVTASSVWFPRKYTPERKEILILL
uniref:Ubiquitin carboxyl-terminal hydrolase n=1 Tax=Rhizophora mucronata TaxID=61149 RepID=A0A2P2JZB9_RHIMU